MFFLAENLNGNMQIVDECESQDKVQCYKENKLGVRIVIPADKVYASFSHMHRRSIIAYTNLRDGKRYKSIYLRDTHKFIFVNESDEKQYELNLTQLNSPIVVYRPEKSGKFIYIDFSPSFWKKKEG